MDILGPLPKILRGNRLVLEMKDRFTKLRGAPPICKTNDSHSTSLMDNYIKPSGIFEYGILDSGAQFTSTLFEAQCASLGIKHEAATAYHL